MRNFCPQKKHVFQTHKTLAIRDPERPRKIPDYHNNCCVWYWNKLRMTLCFTSFLRCYMVLYITSVPHYNNDRTHAYIGLTPGGGYSLSEGYYICSSVSTPLFQVPGKFVEFRPLYFGKNEENVVFWPLYFSKNEENVVFRPLFFIKIGQNV